MSVPKEVVRTSQRYEVERGDLKQYQPAMKPLAIHVVYLYIYIYTYIYIYIYTFSMTTKRRFRLCSVRFEREFAGRYWSKEDEISRL